MILSLIKHELNCKFLVVNLESMSYFLNLQGDRSLEPERNNQGSQYCTGTSCTDKIHRTSH